MKLFVTILALAAMAMADDTKELLNRANNQFTAKMFSEVVKSKPAESVVLSAFSVLTPLSLLSLASVGESHDQLLKAVGFPNDNATKEVASLMNGELRSVKGVELRMANRIYIPNDYQLNEQFESVSKNVFGTEVKNVDFVKNVETASAVNAWVEEQTNNRIKDLVDPESLGSDTRALLVNALYFKGTWKDKFDVEATTQRDFHVSKDKTVKVPTMHRVGHYRYGESSELGAKLLELSYDGGEASFLVVLPLEVDGLTALEEKLKDPAALGTAIQNMREYEVDVYLPKFKIETKTDLKEVLKNLEVTRLFSPVDARLENLLKTSEPLYVSDAVQKAFIEVNEEGAEAAAANEFQVAVFQSLVIYEHREFDANHPFVFVLSKGNTALFSGVFLS